RSIEYRMIRHVGPESFFALLSPAGIYVIQSARFSVDHGQRFGARARIVSIEGVPSRPIEGDFLKIVQWGVKTTKQNEDEPDLFSAAGVNGQLNSSSD
ncbi:MAG: hypothetical protein N2Z21_03965, partial [Candidatus Sumerlaeaceae bacterium]|nr:hypothetical protein [Candidatus Sumerlaeaceae bacterium]